ncbi:hypothetical protein RFI_19977 [Reticulomyxa filosa]|uniref:Uncharacterized protein n=1 Tax=Reticulomyxa filosa TaxID=46433 RepID=X6MUK7_RETFI|nr:hypothetical protein RFI_19977 [Reticulomyxa filosa]|eukprot:ETO17346.1 hypothetical protein RFI_19977 [Reticulomyxa filosa]
MFFQLKRKSLFVEQTYYFDKKELMQSIIDQKEKKMNKWGKATVSERRLIWLRTFLKFNYYVIDKQPQPSSCKKKKFSHTRRKKHCVEVHTECNKKESVCIYYFYFIIKCYFTFVFLSEEKKIVNENSSLDPEMASVLRRYSKEKETVFE